jgi:hypothetical protein
MGIEISAIGYLLNCRSAEMGMSKEQVLYNAVNISPVSAK